MCTYVFFLLVTVVMVTEGEREEKRTFLCFEKNDFLSRVCFFSLLNSPEKENLIDQFFFLSIKYTFNDQKTLNNLV